nr:MAG TPA: hypothetical protein [Caudoviricetes sp.]
MISPSFWYNWNSIFYGYNSRARYLFFVNECLVYEINSTTIFSCCSISGKAYWIYIFAILAIAVYEYLCHPYEVAFSVIRSVL